MLEDFMRLVMALICIVAVAFLILIFVVVPASGSNGSLTVTQTYDSFTGDIYEVVDDETGVCYMLIKYGYGSSITPMYNLNGTLKVKR